MSTQMSVGSASELAMTGARPSPAAPFADTALTRRRSSRRKLRIMIADFLTASIGVTGTAKLWDSGEGRLADHRFVIAGALVALPVFLAYRGLYRSRLISRRGDELKRLFEAIVLWFVGITVVEYQAALPIERGLILLIAAAAFGALALEREVTRRIFSVLRTRRRIARRVIVVGDEVSALAGAENLDREASGYIVVGVILIQAGPLPKALGERAVLGGLEMIFDVVEAEDIDTVLVVDGCLESYVSARLVRQLADLGLHVELAIPVRDVSDARISVVERGRFTVAHVMPPVRSGWPMVAKRSFDVIMAAGALLVLAPILAVAAVAIKLDSAGPVLFRQRRVGRDGVEFRMLKLRTMVPDAELLRPSLEAANENDGPLFKLSADPRVTRVGRFLRRTSLDELPQLVNILRGEMSLVGPRPALPEEVAGWTPDLFHRLRVRPGLTGLWQIKGRSGDDFEAYERYDLYYTDNWSLARDVAIVIQTIPAVLAQKGAR